MNRRRAVLVGSPPRAWGRRDMRWILFFRPRFTPTCVGKTPSRRVHEFLSTVHPHVRGEDESAWGVALRGPGSPPRAWGRRFSTWFILGIGRFTPTCVGKTSVDFYPCALVPVHPHVRGEDERTDPMSSVRPGSPPRAWGRRHRLRLDLISVRFTPTCVGKTDDGTDDTGMDTVHPHVRGEDHMGENAKRDGIGSPPRAWGRRECRYGEQPWQRFTPTCVGKTWQW